MHKTDVPRGSHYAIIVIESQSTLVPGDARSRTDPGHGYPEHTAVFEKVEYLSFPDADKDKWSARLEGLFREERYAIGFHVDKVAVTELQIEVKLVE